MIKLNSLNGATQNETVQINAAIAALNEFQLMILFMPPTFGRA